MCERKMLGEVKERKREGGERGRERRRARHDDERWTCKQKVGRPPAMSPVGGSSS